MCGKRKTTKLTRSNHNENRITSKYASLKQSLPVHKDHTGESFVCI